MTTTTNVLVSGSTSYQDLFAKCDKALRKKENAFDVVFCVGRLTGDARQQEQIPIPIYVLGDDSAEIESSSSSPCKGVTTLNDVGVRTIAGLRVAYLSGGEDVERRRDEVESLLCDSGAYVAGGGVDVLLARRLYPDLLAELPLSYHFLPGSFDRAPYRVGRGRRRVARVVGLPDGKLRAYRITLQSAQDYDDKKWSDELKSASPNPFQAKRNVVDHRPPPGLLRRRREMQCVENSAITETARAAASFAPHETAERDELHCERSCKAAKVADGLPSTFVARGASSRVSAER